jgi:tetratricopeptide (TPR) repeat protein
MMQKLMLSILIVTTCIFNLQAAQFVMNKNMQSAYQAVTNLRFDEYENYIRLEKTTHKENTAIVYVESYKDFMHAFISEQPDKFDKQKELLSERLSAIEDISHDSPWYRFTKAELQIHIAIVKIKYQEYFTAAYQLRRSYKLLEENKKLYPDFIPQYKTLGFFHAAISTVPENYNWLVSIAGFEGSLEEGIKELDKTVKYSDSNPSLRYIYGEAILLRIIAAINFEKKPALATDMLDHLHPSFDGPLRKFILASTYSNNKITGDEIDFFKTTSLVDKNCYPLRYLYYMRGMVYLNNMHLNDAETDFTRYIGTFKGTSLIKSSWQKLSWIAFLQNDSAGYNSSMEGLSNAKGLFTDEDKQAQKEYELKVIPNIHLLKARILFDGGNYHESLNAIAGKPIEEFPTTRDRVELTYRMARINDEMGRTASALKHYRATVSIGKDLPYYFAANAALHSGYIYESEGNYEQATISYKECLKIRGHDYQNSIDQKAKSGLQRIKLKNKN